MHETTLEQWLVVIYSEMQRLANIQQQSVGDLFSGNLLTAGSTGLAIGKFVAWTSLPNFGYSVVFNFRLKLFSEHISANFSVWKKLLDPNEMVSEIAVHL